MPGGESMGRGTAWILCQKEISLIWREDQVGIDGGLCHKAGPGEMEIWRTWDRLVVGGVARVQSCGNASRGVDFERRGDGEVIKSELDILNSVPWSLQMEIVLSKWIWRCIWSLGESQIWDAGIHAISQQGKYYSEVNVMAHKRSGETQDSGHEETPEGQPEMKEENRNVSSM